MANQQTLLYVIGAASVLLLALVGLLVWWRRRKRSQMAGADLYPEQEHQETDVATAELVAVEVEPAVEPLAYIPEVVQHYTAFFATQPRQVSDPQETRVAIATFAPAHKRGWWTYGTVGLSVAGESELIFSSYEENLAMVGQLAKVGSDIRDKWQTAGRSVAIGDAFTLAQPLGEGENPLTHLFVTYPYFEEDGFAYYIGRAGTVRFLTLVPIYAAEYKYLLMYGNEALEEQFALQQVNTLDLRRGAVV